MRRRIFRRKAPSREKVGHTKSRERRWTNLYRATGEPESKLSRYLSRLLDADAG